MDRTLLGVGILVLGLAACGRAPAPPDQPGPPTIEAPAPPGASLSTIHDTVQSREQLLAILDQVTSAYAAGQPYPEEASQLANVKFSVRMPFACPGVEEGASTAAYDETDTVLRLALKATVFERGAAIWTLAGGAESDHVEGFWLERPWLRTPDCPTLPQTGSQPGQTFAMVQIFTTQGSRILRAGPRGFEAVLKGSAAAAARAGGVRLVLEGRVADVADRRPLRCAAQDANQRPICVLIVSVDRLAFESPSGEVLSAWGGG